jgi:NAD(P)-dependent dehydrogenase (short-subunit alcohol dehydrogenase family)
MARILITGSSDGLGLLAAKCLVQRGHSVVLHARNLQRAKDASASCPGAENVVTADLSSLSETKNLAHDVNKLGAFDCIIHNAGLYRGPFRKTPEGIPALFAVNTIAPYVLANLIQRPKRLVFLSSERHRKGDNSLNDYLWTQRGEGGWDEAAAYEDSKLHNVMFAKAFARHWPDAKVNAMDPGWVPTKMGGIGAPDDIDHAIETYVMLAEGVEPDTQKTGRYFRPGKREVSAESKSEDEEAQEKFLELCAEFTGVKTL